MAGTHSRQEVWWPHSLGIVRTLFVFFVFTDLILLGPAAWSFLVSAIRGGPSWIYMASNPSQALWGFVIACVVLLSITLALWWTQSRLVSRAYSKHVAESILDPLVVSFEDAHIPAALRDELLTGITQEIVANLARTQSRPILLRKPVVLLRKRPADAMRGNPRVVCEAARVTARTALKRRLDSLPPAISEKPMEDARSWQDALGTWFLHVRHRNGQLLDSAFLTQAIIR